MTGKWKRRILIAVPLGVVMTALIATAALAQWMDGRMRHGMMRGKYCRMMDVSPQPVDPSTLPEPESPGAEILKNKCTQCHGLVSPRQHASQQWPYIIERMDRRMHMMSRGEMGMMRRPAIQPLTLEEKNQLLGYLQQNAFRGIEGSNLPEASDPEAQAFAQACSQCHALPEPSAYTSEEWEGIVNRMSVNMENMGFESLTPKQKRGLLGYLEKNARGQ